MLKIRGAISINKIKELEESNDINDMSYDRIQLLATQGENIFKALVKGMCVKQACTIKMIKKQIDKFSRDKSIPIGLKVYIHNSKYTLKQMICFIIIEGYRSNNSKVNYDNTNGAWKAYHIGWFQRRYYLYDSKYVCPFLIDDVDLPLYINHKWEYDCYTKYYNDRVKNCKVRG